MPDRVPYTVAERERDAIENRMAERSIASTIEVKSTGGIGRPPCEMIGFGLNGDNARRRSTSEVDLRRETPNPAI